MRMKKIKQQWEQECKHFDTVSNLNEVVAWKQKGNPIHALYNMLRGLIIQNI